MADPITCHCARSAITQLSKIATVVGMILTVLVAIVQAFAKSGFVRRWWRSKCGYMSKGETHRQQIQMDIQRLQRHIEQFTVSLSASGSSGSSPPRTPPASPLPAAPPLDV